MMAKDEQNEYVYHATFDCWQQYFGYNDLYDTIFNAATSMRAAKFDFYDKDGDGLNDYILWAWKGDYLNLGAGAELGIYKRWDFSDEIWIVDKNLAMTMTIKLVHRYKGELFNWRPAAKQWWITGFNYNCSNVNRDDLTATYTVIFNMTKTDKVDPQALYKSFKSIWGKKDGWTYSGNVATLVL